MATLLRSRTDESTYTKSRWILKGFLLIVVFALGFLLKPSGNPVVVKSDLPGPSRVVNGIPVGYPQTQDGAFSAAMNYSQAYGEAAFASDDELNSMVATFVVSNMQETERKNLSELRNQVGAQLGTDHVFATSLPVSGKVLSFNSDRAVVRIWTIGLATGPNQKGLIQSCGLIDRTLVWSEGDWKYESAAESGTCPVSVPDLGSTPSTPDQVWDVVNGTTRFFYAPIG